MQYPTLEELDNITVLVCPCCHWLCVRKNWHQGLDEFSVKCRLCDTEYYIEDCKVWRKDGEVLRDFTAIREVDE
jgi:hypothetical protein